MDSIISKSSGRIVARGVYEGEAGEITIPAVDMSKASVILLSSTWAFMDTGSAYGASAFGSVYISLINSTTIKVNNEISFTRQYSAGSSKIETHYITVSWEVISYD